MSATSLSAPTRSRNNGTPPPDAASIVPTRSHLSAAQRRELEGELRRELVVLERRLAGERQAESAEPHVADANDVAVALHGTGDTAVRRDVVASALARIASGTYGSCSHCGEPIAYGRLVVMPETTNCLECRGRS
jgi:DnaK suppressor protein